VGLDEGKDAEDMREGVTVVGGVKNERSSSFSRKSLWCVQEKIRGGWTLDNNKRT
jgi:hypothetical protein